MDSDFARNLFGLRADLFHCSGTIHSNDLTEFCLTTEESEQFIGDKLLDLLRR